VLVRRLLSDPRVPRRRKLLLALLVAYLAMPFNLVPDFIPVASQLDDAILVALVLRTILTCHEEVRDHGDLCAGELGRSHVLTARCFT